MLSKSSVQPNVQRMHLVGLGGERAEELGLLLGGLEATVAELGRGVDELEVDGLEMFAAGGDVEGLAQDEGTLLDADAGTLEHDPILVDLSVADKAAHGGDALLGEVSLGLAGGLVAGLADAVDLLVHLSTVEVAVLAGTGDGRRDAGGMPRSDTGHLAKTTVGLTREAGDAPTGGDALVSLTLGDADDVEVLVLGEDGVDGDLLLEEGLCEVDLGLGVGATVDLDLHDVGLLDAEVELLGLGVGYDTDDGAELGDAVELVLDVLGTVLGVLLGVLGVGLLLGLEPVFVAAALELLGEMLGEDGGEGAEAAGSLDVSDDADDNHGRSFEDGDGVDDLALVHEGAGTVDAADDVGHAGLVGAEGREVGSGGGIGILGEGADAAGVVLGALLGQEAQVAVTGSLELAVGPANSERKRNVEGCMRYAYMC